MLEEEKVTIDKDEYDYLRAVEFELNALVNAVLRDIEKPSYGDLRLKDGGSFIVKYLIVADDKVSSKVKELNSKTNGDE